MATRPRVTSNIAKGQDANGGKPSSSPTKFDFNGILNIQPVDEANTEYLTVEMKVNGVSREVRVPVPFLNRRHPDDVPKDASAPSPSTPDGSIIRSLLTELEEEVSHHVMSSEKVTHDVNENRISDSAKSGTNSGDSDISLDNVIVIAPDDDDDDDRDDGGGEHPVDKRPVVSLSSNTNIKRLPKVAPKIAPLTTATAPVSAPVGQRVAISRPSVTPVTVLPEVAYQSGKVTQNSGRVIILGGAGVKQQFMVMSKQSGDVYLTPVSGSPSPAEKKPTSAKPGSSTTVLRLVGNKAGVVGNDGNIYIPVGTTPGRGSILKKALPIPKASTSSPEPKIDGPLTTNVSVISNTAAPNVVKTGALKTLDYLKAPRSILKLAAAPSCPNTVEKDASSWRYSPNSGSVDDLRITSVCSLVPPREQEKENGPSTDCTPGKGLLHAILNDLKKPFPESNSAKPESEDTHRASSPGRERDDEAREEGFLRRREEIKPEWLRGFKEDPELRVLVEKLDLGPRFKSIHADRLQPHLAYRRRLRRAERRRRASDHVYSAKEPQNVKKEEGCDLPPAKEGPNSNVKTDKPGKMIMIKTSLGSYILPMVPGLTMSGLLRSMNSGLVKLPPVKTQCLVELPLSGKGVGPATGAGTTSSAYSPTALTVKTEPTNPVQGAAAQVRQSGLTTAGSRLSVTRLPPATESAKIRLSPPLLNLNSTSKCSSGNAVSLLKRPASSDSDLIKPKKSKADLSVDHAAEPQADDNSSQAVGSPKTEEQDSKKTAELTHVNRIKQLKEMLKEQEAAIEKMRKQRLEISRFLKEIE